MWNQLSATLSIFAVSIFYTVGQHFSVLPVELLNKFMLSPPPSPTCMDPCWVPELLTCCYAWARRQKVGYLSVKLTVGQIWKDTDFRCSAQIPNMIYLFVCLFIYFTWGTEECVDQDRRINIANVWCYMQILGKILGQRYIYKKLTWPSWHGSYFTFRKKVLKGLVIFKESIPWDFVQ